MLCSAANFPLSLRYLNEINGLEINFTEGNFGIFHEGFTFAADEISIILRMVNTNFKKNSVLMLNEKGSRVKKNMPQEVKQNAIQIIYKFTNHYF